MLSRQALQVTTSLPSGAADYAVRPRASPNGNSRTLSGKRLFLLHPFFVFSGHHPPVTLMSLLFGATATEDPYLKCLEPHESYPQTATDCIFQHLSLWTSEKAMPKVCLSCSCQHSRPKETTDIGHESSPFIWILSAL